LLLGILVATTAFTVLTGTSDSQRLEVRGAVAKSFRTQFYILVRPRGARTSLEQQRGLLRPGVLTGIFGGISMRQWQQVLRVGGVEVAAPIATVGYTLPDALVPVDVTAEAAGASPGLYRVRIERSTDRGLTRREDVPAYVWVTDKTLLRERGSGRADDPTNYAPRLRTADGGSRAVCASGYWLGPTDQ
jgi:hypothetical protein